MLYLRMHRADLPVDKVAKVAELKKTLGSVLHPLLFPALEVTASILGISASKLLASHTSRREITAADSAVDGELYTDGESLVSVAIHLRKPGYVMNAERMLFEATPANSYRLEVNAVGPRWESSAVVPVLDSVERILEVRPTPYYYRSDRFQELKSEGRESPGKPSLEEVQASEILGNKIVRGLALAIKSSGGLLLNDIAKQLPPDSREGSHKLVEQLKIARVVDSEIVIVCSKTQSQVTRAANRELINELSLRGLKCACGRPLIDERVEEALTVTDLGRALLDKARWFTVLLMQELERVGVLPDAILIEQTVEAMNWTACPTLAEN